VGDHQPGMTPEDHSCLSTIYIFLKFFLSIFCSSAGPQRPAHGSEGYPLIGTENSCTWSGEGPDFEPGTVALQSGALPWSKLATHPDTYFYD
jgi:hypothetical protein